MKNLRPGDALAGLIQSRLHQGGWDARIYGPGTMYTGDTEIRGLDDDIKIHVSGLWAKPGTSICINISKNGDRCGYDLAPVKMPKIEALLFKQRITDMVVAFNRGLSQ